MEFSQAINIFLQDLYFHKLKIFELSDIYRKKFDKIKDILTNSISHICIILINEKDFDQQNFIEYFNRNHKSLKNLKNNIKIITDNGFYGNI